MVVSLTSTVSVYPWYVQRDMERQGNEHSLPPGAYEEGVISPQPSYFHPPNLGPAFAACTRLENLMQNVFDKKKEMHRKGL